MRVDTIREEDSEEAGSPSASSAHSAGLLRVQGLSATADSGGGGGGGGGAVTTAAAPAAAYAAAHTAAAATTTSVAPVDPAEPAPAEGSRAFNFSVTDTDAGISAAGRPSSDHSENSADEQLDVEDIFQSDGEGGGGYYEGELNGGDYYQEYAEYEDEFAFDTGANDGAGDGGMPAFSLEHFAALTNMQL